MNLKPLISFCLLLTLLPVSTTSAADKPHIIFVMADDMGWGQTSYRNHPVLKTPHLDAMAANGLRFERFYAGGPVCSPTRASVMTGRSHTRTGVLTHGYALRKQEATIAQALSAAGYVTGHFGKWHLNGHQGPGAPILADDPYSPGKFGFDEWVSVSNFYDVDPLMSRAGEIIQLQGDSSEVAVDQAVQFLKKHHQNDKPTFAVIWYGTPHSPFKALDDDKAAFTDLNDASANHYGELVAMDRSIGTLRSALRDLKIADNTLLVFCSDNGGLPNIQPETTGGLRGNKGSVFEGGLRVPGIFEWPAVIQPRVTDYAACVMDLFPTVADLLQLPHDSQIQPSDGISLKPLLTQELASREQPMGFRYQNKRVLIAQRYKVLTNNFPNGKLELYDLQNDPAESQDISAAEPQIFARMQQQLLDWNTSVDASFDGKDYPEERVTPADPEPVNWYDTPQYQPFLKEWSKRWEFDRYLNRPAARKRSK
jgi:arylsulfatase A-like enzyme